MVALIGICMFSNIHIRRPPFCVPPMNPASAVTRKLAKKNQLYCHFGPFCLILFECIMESEITPRSMAKPDEAYTQGR